MKTKNFKKIAILTGLFLLIAVTSAACARTGVNGAAVHPPQHGPYAVIFKYIGSPFEHLIKGTANMIGGSNGYAFGIIIISFLVRLVLLPLGLNQSHKATTQQEKMKAIQPQLNLIQEKQKQATSQEAQAKISQLMMKVYKENNLSLVGGIGCLPLLIQFPILIGIYQAVQYSPDIGSAMFLGLPLGKPSFVIAIVAALFYVAQSYISLIGISEAQKKQMRTVMLMNPLVTFFISMYSSAALALYFLIGGVVILIQQIITTFILTPRIRKNIDKDLQKNPIKQVITEAELDAILNGETKDTNSSQPTNNTNNDSSNKSLEQIAREKNKNLQQRPNKKD